MAYAKLPKVAQDYVVGFQSINQAIENEQAHRDALDAFHVVDPPQPVLGAGLVRAFGAHDDPLVPVAAVRVEVIPVAYGGQGGFYLETQYGDDRIGGITRDARGLYFLDLIGMTGEFFATATAEWDDDTDVRHVDARKNSRGSGVGLKCLLRQQLGSPGVFTAEDFSFSLTVFDGA